MDTLFLFNSTNGESRAVIVTHDELVDTADIDTLELITSSEAFEEFDYNSEGPLFVVTLIDGQRPTLTDDMGDEVPFALLTLENSDSAEG